MRAKTFVVVTALSLIVFLCFLKQSPDRIFKRLEQQYHGHYGVYLLNTATGKTITFREHDRFPLCSTAKVMIVAAVLKQSMLDNTLLSKRIMYAPQDVQSSGYAPITKQHVDSGMTVAKLCQAAISYSDNAAANLLIEVAGGPQKITLFARSIGDTAFRLDRTEPALNSAIPGDQRDTSTPRAMALSLQKLILGDVLGSHQKALLKKWLVDNTTGDDKIRAVIPQDWTVGDKTGAGEYGASNDVAIIWPPNRQPIIISIYFRRLEQDAVPEDQVVAEMAAQVMRLVGWSARKNSWQHTLLKIS